MSERKIGEWTIQWGSMIKYTRSFDDEGFPCNNQIESIYCYAVRKYGDIYNCNIEFQTIEWAAEYCNSLPNNFDPGNYPGWSFFRNSYGSEAYQDNWHQEEYDRMSPEERRRY